MVMSTKALAEYLEPLLGEEFEHVQVIRIGTKSLGYWPYRYLHGEDADSLLRCFEKVVASGKHLAIMSHFSHWKELETRAARAAIARLSSVGVVIRTQSPLIRHVNVARELGITNGQVTRAQYLLYLEQRAAKRSGAGRQSQTQPHLAERSAN